jgi:hypothetical protein
MLCGTGSQVSEQRESDVDFLDATFFDSLGSLRVFVVVALFFLGGLSMVAAFSASVSSSVVRGATRDAILEEMKNKKSLRGELTSSRSCLIVCRLPWLVAAGFCELYREELVVWRLRTVPFEIERSHHRSDVSA